MERDTFRELIDLVGDALEQPESSRDAWLEQRCAGDAELLREARALLDLSVAPTLHGVTRDIETRVGRAALDLEPTARTPGRIGPYVVDGVLGEGGMGIVYAARQEKPLERDVALKVVRGSALRPRLGARLEAEMGLLATLDHPYVARIYDAGATEDGGSYFAMERIEGRPVTDYCTVRELGTRARLELFLKVLRAVGHAHQKAVVHRDLKPSNILVTEVDGEATPKLIDFGIALAASDLELGRDERTAVLGTPEYMSPEAIAGAEVDTRADVYALGVLLHELLTDRLPSRGDTGSGTDGAHESPDVQRIPRDLRCIVDKAMARNPDDRYATVAQLADDIVRYLASYPVEARPATVWYNLQRFAVRNRAPVLGLGAAVVVLLGVSAMFTLRLAEQRDLAETEAAKATEVAEFLQDLFRAPDPDVPGAADLTAREILDRGVDRVFTELSDQPEVQAALLGVIADTYGGLGLWTEAVEHLEEAVERERALKGPDHPDVGVLLRRLGQARSSGGDFSGAETAVRESLAILRASLGPTAPETGEAMTQLALVLMRGESRLAEADSIGNEAVGILRTATGEEHEASLATALHTLAFVKRTRLQLPEARALNQEALAIRRRVLDPTHPDVLMTASNLAVVVEHMGRFPEAEALHREVLAGRRARLGAEHPDVLTSMNNLASVLWRMGRYAEAESVFREIVPVARVVHGEQHPTTAILINNLGVATLRAGDPVAAQALHREALEMNRRLLGEEHARVAGDLGNLGKAVLAAGDPPGARAIHRQALEMRVRLLGESHPDVASSLVDLAAVSLAESDAAGAVGQLRRALEIRTRALSEDSPWIAEVRHHLGVALGRTGAAEEAEGLLRAALEVRTAALDPGHPDIGATRRELAHLLQGTGRLAEAASQLREARAHAADRLGENHPEVQAIDAQLASLPTSAGTGG